MIHPEPCASSLVAGFFLRRSKTFTAQSSIWKNIGLCRLLTRWFDVILRGVTT